MPSHCLASHRPNRPTSPNRLICPRRQVKDINLKRFRHIPLVGRLEIWLVVQVGIFMGKHSLTYFRPILPLKFLHTIWSMGLSFSVSRVSFCAVRGWPFQTRKLRPQHRSLLHSRFSRRGCFLPSRDNRRHNRHQGRYYMADCTDR